MSEADSKPESEAMSLPSGTQTPQSGDMITSEMKSEEKKMVDEDKKEQKKKVTQFKTDDYDSVVESQRVVRLKSLVERSKIYTSILSEKLLKQQAAQRASATKKESAAAIENTNDSAKSKKENVTGRKTRHHENHAEATAPAKKQKKADSTANTNKKAYNLADYVGDAMIPQHGASAETSLRDKQNGAEEESADEGFTSVSKPSTSTRQPELITGGQLRDYQLAGLEWLISLYENGLNGILADEMGLGKTLQTISFLAFLRSKGTMGPFLVAAPLSTLANWINEFNTFAPSIPCVLYHGSKDTRADIRSERMRKIDKDFPIVVTSYEIIMNDRQFLSQYKWKFIVIDEGHRIKNLNCRLVQELKSYDSANRLLLTGTPLQNNLKELWSLLNFILPEIFDDADEFERWFDFSSLKDKNLSKHILDEEQKNSIVTNLHLILKPFLLRRMKVDVETSLPRKREYIIQAPLTQQQHDLYQATLSHDLRSYLINKQLSNIQTEESDASITTSSRSQRNGTPNGKGAGRKRDVDYREVSEAQFFKDIESQNNSGASTPATEASTEEKALLRASEYRYVAQFLTGTDKLIGPMKLQNMIMQLRKTSNHPFLFDWPIVPGTDQYLVDDTIVSSSGKMMILNRLLPELFKRGHKVLLFSQFSTMLDIIEDWANGLKNWDTYRIDGTIAQEERQKQIKSFNDKKSKVKLFLLSTRAGGLGINLTGADTVIIFDSDWNPQQDLQAQDRAHRIGQSKPVVVYRIVSANTIEAKILDKATSKRRLEKLVIQKGKFKSLNNKSEDKESVDDLSEILLQDDAEKIIIKEKFDEVLTDADLDRLLDRR